MAKNTKHPSWAKAQPHHVKTGLITTQKFAEANPNKVEWVTAKKSKGGK